MKAVVCDDFGDASVTDVPDPKVGPGDVLVAVHRVQLSVTECELFDGQEVAHYETVTTRLASGDGQLFGHEFCGKAVRTGDAVTGIEVGDRVYAPGKITCGSCIFCTRGSEQYCENKEGIGFERPGALAEYISVPEDVLCSVPDALSDAEAAALQPLASALLCVDDAGIQSGDVVTVIGTGVMGYQCGQLAFLQGAAEVYALDSVEAKRSLAADRDMVAVDPDAGDPIQRIRDATDGIGSDVIFEAVGGDQSHGTTGTDPLSMANNLVRPGGTVVQVGHISGEIEVRPDVLRSKSITTINPDKGVRQIGPNSHTGNLAGELVANNRLSIEEYVGPTHDGLMHFTGIVDSMLDAHADSLGPPQIRLK